jgi:hypothetical protein
LATFSTAAFPIALRFVDLRAARAVAAVSRFAEVTRDDAFLLFIALLPFGPPLDKDESVPHRNLPGRSNTSSLSSRQVSRRIAAELGIGEIAGRFGGGAGVVALVLD